jgi:hypothetical protein
MLSKINLEYVRKRFLSTKQKYRQEKVKGLTAGNQGFYSFSCQLHQRTSGIPNLENEKLCCWLQVLFVPQTAANRPAVLGTMRQCCTI